jgi:hypothetical protein
MNFLSWIASIFIEKFIKYFWIKVSELTKHVIDEIKLSKLKKIDEQNAEKYNKVITSDKATEEEIIKATTDLLNGSDNK